MSLTYRASPANTAHAAYQGAIRVGYVVKSSSRGDWIAYLNVLGTTGGYPTARRATLEEAKSALQLMFLAWLGEANLTEIPNE